MIFSPLKKVFFLLGICLIVFPAGCISLSAGGQAGADAKTRQGLEQETTLKQANKIKIKYNPESKTFDIDVNTDSGSGQKSDSDQDAQARADAKARSELTIGLTVIAIALLFLYMLRERLPFIKKLLGKQ